MLPSCIFLGPVTHESPSFNVHHCHKLQRNCTEADHGLLNKDMTPYLNCAGCQLGSNPQTLIDLMEQRGEDDTFPDGLTPMLNDGEMPPEALRRWVTDIWPKMPDLFVLGSVLSKPHQYEALIKGISDCGGKVWKEWPTLHSYMGVVSKKWGPKVSGVCLTFGHPKRLDWLGEAVESFLRQTWANKELVIVNDDPLVDLVFDHPQVKILNLKERTPTLGEKYNIGVAAATGSIICSWDDDDISLPHRMKLAADNLRKYDYYNPKAYYFLDGDKLQHEVKTGYAHNASAYRKSAWEQVGGYKAVSGPQDAIMDGDLMKQTRAIIGAGHADLTAYIYRWQTGSNLSGATDTNHNYMLASRVAGAGTFEIKPAWKQDYVGRCRRLMELDQWAAQKAPVQRVIRETEAKSGPLVTIGMATHNDYQGLWATLQSLRLHHPELQEQMEIVVVDNTPMNSPHLQHNKTITERGRNSRYVHYTERQGTASTKDMIFQFASGKGVCVIDCHVLLPFGVGAKLVDFYQSIDYQTEVGPDDLFHGPILGDECDGTLVGTEFKPTWGTWMHGQWDINREAYAAGRPFEIWGSGCGLFTCKRSSWLGFSQHTRGFGGEEGYIHAKYRKNGRKVWCLPWLQWSHRFGNFTNTNYPIDDRSWNYLISHYEVDEPSLEEIEQNFVGGGGVTMSHYVRQKEEAQRVIAMTGSRVRMIPHQNVQFVNDTGEKDWEREYLAQDNFACPHRLARLGSTLCNIGCPSMRAEAVSVYECAQKGKVTVARRRTDLQDCLGCGVLNLLSEQPRSVVVEVR